jgi:hypothetical protein
MPFDVVMIYNPDYRGSLNLSRAIEVNLSDPDSLEIRSKQDNADAILGNAALKRFNLIFDYAGGNLYIRPNGHFDEPFERRKGKD